MSRAWKWAPQDPWSTVAGEVVLLKVRPAVEWLTSGESRPALEGGVLTIGVLRQGDSLEQAAWDLLARSATPNDAGHPVLDYTSTPPWRTLPTLREGSGHAVAVGGQCARIRALQRGAQAWLDSNPTAVAS